MRIVAIIQARMGSTRLPGKALRDICGRTMLARVVRRADRSRLVDEVVVATTTRLEDTAIVDECRSLGVRSFRGSEQDVLDRYHGAASEFNADSIVRITSDCPLIDPEIIDNIVQAFLEKRPDYASNTLVSTYPRGLDVEVFSRAALDRAHAEARLAHQRVHVTPYLYQNPAIFRLLSIAAEEDYSRYRWTVDTKEDLDLLRAVYGKLGGDDGVSWRDVIVLMGREPGLAEINRHIRQKSLEEC